MLLPRLNTIAIPIFVRNITGVRNESIVIRRTRSDNAAAIATYTGISFKARFLISVTTPDIPLA